MYALHAKVIFRTCVVLSAQKSHVEVGVTFQMSTSQFGSYLLGIMLGYTYSVR